MKFTFTFHKKIQEKKKTQISKWFSILRSRASKKLDLDPEWTLDLDLLIYVGVTPLSSLSFGLKGSLSSLN